MSGVSALAEQTPVCLPSVAATRATPAAPAASRPAEAEKHHGHGHGRGHGHGKDK